MALVPARKQVLCGHDRMQSVSITTEVCEFDIDGHPLQGVLTQHYSIKFVRDLQYFIAILCAIWFPQ